MEPLSDPQIRSSFVNCTKGEAGRLRLPLDFRDLPWPDLDFLGWIDPGAPQRAHIVVPQDAGLVGITLRVPGLTSASTVKSSLCQICLTGHASSGVNLLAAPLAGKPGRNGNTVGIYLCADLACSLYIRGKRQPKLRFARYEESLSPEEKAARAIGNLEAFIGRVMEPEALGRGR